MFLYLRFALTYKHPWKTTRDYPESYKGLLDLTDSARILSGPLLHNVSELTLGHIPYSIPPSRVFFPGNRSNF
ncbi:hypothetical protein FKM82_029073 [Ascaphus truei]